MQKWANNIRNIQEDERFKLSIVAAIIMQGLVQVRRMFLGICWGWQKRNGKTR